jgi:hypothetical protein
MLCRPEERDEQVGVVSDDPEWLTITADYPSVQITAVASFSASTPAVPMRC